ncbi:MAG TPA: type II secretion system F family protein [Streptosporangiaceae bacterium]|nr:type II secretion system F family protein [Streptosporangiaceae bacterium]
MSLALITAGLLAGLGCWLAISELIPAGPSLRAAMDRLDSTGAQGRGMQGTGSLPVRLGCRLAAAMPWLPVPVRDLRLLGQDPPDWLASKVSLGFAGVALVPVVSALMSLAGRQLPWTIPAGGALALGAALFFAPDLVTRVNARQQRADFRHALTSYLDLVVLERGAGAAPTEALEAAAEVGQGWAFERIGAALSRARKASAPPWDGLASLADEIGISELADLAVIAAVAGHEGARILDSLSARAESMRAEALAATRAQAGARSTTMVLPIALLAGGFLVLLIFPDFYRLFG